MYVGGLRWSCSTHCTVKSFNLLLPDVSALNSEEYAQSEAPKNERSDAVNQLRI